MSSVTTYVMTVNDDDVSTLRELNAKIRAHYLAEGYDGITSRRFFEMAGRHPSLRSDVNEFFAAHLNHFGVAMMLKSMNRIDWKFPRDVVMLARGENDTAFKIIRFYGPRNQNEGVFVREGSD
jgi:hypothetical protein